jgi:PAS domain S-box-containing protein
LKKPKKKPASSVESPRLSEERFRRLVESVRDYAIFMLAPDGTIASWNPGAERLKGYKAEEIIGRHFSIFYTKPDLDAKKPERELETAARTGKYEEEGWRLRKDGTVFWASVVLSAIRDEDGELLGFAKVTRDLTERRAQEEKLRHAVEELTKSNRELDEYAAFVSHDLQEPLRKMASFAQLLEAEYGEKLDGSARKYLNNIVDGAKRMRTLITDVLDYSRIGRAEPPMAPLRLDEIAAAALRDLELVVKDSGGKVELGPLPELRGNAERLTRLFQNLIGNGLKYRDPAREALVRVSARRVDGEWIIDFADNGIGFEPQFAERIMRPFQRLHAKHKYPGSGIGLAAAKKIVDLHRGRLWADSEPGKGSVFHVALPAEAS